MSLSKLRHTSFAVLKSLVQPDFLALFSSLLLGWFTLISLNSWPFKVAPSFLAATIMFSTIVGFILVLLWRIIAKIKTRRSRLLFFVTELILMGIFLYAGSMSILITKVAPKEIASTTIDSTDYHLVYSANCTFSCATDLDLYRCEAIKWLCSSIDSISYTYTSYRPPKGEPFDYTKVSLVVTKGQENIQLVDENRAVVAEFRNSSALFNFSWCLKRTYTIIVD